MIFRILALATAVFLSTRAAGQDGFTQLFDGKTLNGWDGDPVYRSVKGGAIVGEVTPETLLEKNSFLIWQGGTVGDFELVVEYRVSEKGNSGINYRSVVKGSAMKHFVNGALMSEVEDLDPEKRVLDGRLGVQVHVGPPMVIEYRKIELKRLDGNIP